MGQHSSMLGIKFCQLLIKGFTTFWQLADIVDVPAHRGEKPQTLKAAFLEDGDRQMKPS